MPNEFIIFAILIMAGLANIWGILVLFSLLRGGD